MLPISMFTTSFIRVPAPTAPKWNFALPIASKSAAQSAYSASSPPARTMSAPAAAGPFEPETGASRKRPPLDVTCSDSRIMSSGASVAQSTMHLPAPTPASTPPSISYTAFTASGVESITYTRSHAFTTSAGDASTVTASAASAFSASHLAAERFHTTSERPDFRGSAPCRRP